MGTLEESRDTGKRVAQTNASKTYSLNRRNNYCSMHQSNFDVRMLAPCILHTAVFTHNDIITVNISAGV